MNLAHIYAPNIQENNQKYTIPEDRPLASAVNHQTDVNEFEIDG